MENTERLERLLPAGLRELTGPLPEDMTELRLRAGRPVQIVSLSGEAMAGGCVSERMVRETAQALSGHSLYAREEELAQGYFTMEGGMRVGVCGRMAGGRLTHIGSLAVRVARQVMGAADRVMDALFVGGRPVSALVISPPGLGKTTLLRDIARQLSDGTGGQPAVRVGIADERGELAGCVLGIPALDVGARTDVMDGCSKKEGMLCLIRSMSPEVIVTDELGRPEDAWAVKEALRSGVQVIASVHAQDEQEARMRLGEGAQLFRKMIVLGGAVGRIERISEGSGWK